MTTTTKRTRSYSAEQSAYLLAKATCDTLLEHVGTLLNDLLDACGSLETDEEIEAYCEQEARVHHDFGTRQAEKSLREAEQALLAWGIEQARTSKQANKEQLQLIERLATTPLLKYRQCALDLMMRLDAPAQKG